MTAVRAKLQGWCSIMLRLLLASVGVYCATYSLVYLITPLLPLSKADAVILASCLSFPLMVAGVLWCYAERRLYVVLAVLLLPVVLATLGAR